MTIRLVRMKSGKYHIQEWAHHTGWEPCSRLLYHEFSILENAQKTFKELIEKDSWLKLDTTVAEVLSTYGY